MYNTLIKWVAIVFVIIASHYSMYSFGKNKGLQEVKTAETIYNERLEIVKNVYEESVEELRYNKNEEINRINASLDDALKRLQQRPSRPQVITETREIRESCTGRELFKEDGEFLTREAARAERILTERNFYFKQYEEARLMLERLNNE